MATGDGGAYSYSLTVFSPSGKLVQIEHALARVSQGTTSLGIKGGPEHKSVYARKLTLPLLCHSDEWDRNRDGKEVVLVAHGHLDDRESVHDLSQYRHRILWNGTRLQGKWTLSRPERSKMPTRKIYLGTSVEGKEERAGLLEDLWRVPTDARARSGTRDRDATGHAIWVRPHVFRYVHEALHLSLTAESVPMVYRC